MATMSTALVRRTARSAFWQNFEAYPDLMDGMVWRGEKRRALVMDPSGQGYVVEEGDKIGKNDGRVLGIDDSTIKVREEYVDFHGEKTSKEIDMRIRQSQGG